MEQEHIRTFYKNLYRPKQLPVIKDEEASSPEDFAIDNCSIDDLIKERTIHMTDDRAKYYTNTSRVGWKGRFDYSMLSYEEAKARENAEFQAYLSDPNKLLECAISTILLLAKKGKVPQNNFMCTELYLKNIRNEFGDHPNNIELFLKYLNYQKRIGNVEAYKKYKYNIPDVTLTKISDTSKSSKFNPCGPIDI